MAALQFRRGLTGVYGRQKKPGKTCGTGDLGRRFFQDHPFIITDILICHAVLVTYDQAWCLQRDYLISVIRIQVETSTCTQNTLSVKVKVTHEHFDPG